LAAPIVTAQLLSSDSERRFDATSEEALAGRRSAGVSAEDRTAVDRFGPLRASTASRTSSRDNRLSIARSNFERRLQAYLQADRLVRSVTIAWLVGVAVLLGRMIGGWLYVRRLQCAALGAEASRWQAAGARIADRMGLSVAAHVVETAM